MARTPNYNFEHNERDRAKAAKKAEKLAAKEAKKLSNEIERTEPRSDQD